jgi:hypothetical protein
MPARHPKPKQSRSHGVTSRQHCSPNLSPRCLATLTYCSCTFFEQCLHRMVCAHCDFYTPEGSSQAQLLEARDNLQHMLVFIPLTGDECGRRGRQTAVDMLGGRRPDHGSRKSAQSHARQGLRACMP